MNPDEGTPEEASDENDVDGGAGDKNEGPSTPGHANQSEGADVGAPGNDGQPTDPQEAGALAGRQNRARTSERTRAWHRAIRQEAREEFIAPMRTFHASMDALTDLHHLMTPLVADIEEKRFRSAAENLLSGLTPEQRSRVVQVLRIITETTDRPSDGENIEGDDEGQDQATRIHEIALELGEKAHLVRDVFALVHRGRFNADREALMRGALLPVAVGAFEVLVAALARGYYLVRPSALGDEPKFSLKDMESFESIEDVRDEAIARRVESLVHGDLSDWTTWFEKNPQVFIENLALDFPTIFEVFQRRHIFIHNGGRVTRLYLKRMEPFAGKRPELNASLPVDGAYLDRALAEIETLGDLLAAGVWSKCWPDQEKFAMSELNDRAYDLLLDAKWQVVEKLCSVGLHVNCDETLKMIFKANYFLAIKREGRFEEVKQAVRDWDTSALALRFDFIRSVLLDELDVAFPMAEELMRRNDLGPSDLAEWPALAELRADPRYHDLVPDAPDDSESDEASQ